MLSDIHHSCNLSLLDTVSKADDDQYGASPASRLHETEYEDKQGALHMSYDRSMFKLSDIWDIRNLLNAGILFV